MTLFPRMPNFGTECFPGDYCYMKIPMESCLRQWGIPTNFEGSTKVAKDSDGFQVTLEVQPFTPAEVKIRIAGKEIIVEGKHEEKQDEAGYVSRQFTRRYVVPPGHDIETATSTISTDGILTITVKRWSLKDDSKTIPIIQTGKAFKITEDKKAQEAPAPSASTFKSKETQACPINQACPMPNNSQSKREERKTDMSKSIEPVKMDVAMELLKASEDKPKGE